MRMRPNEHTSVSRKSSTGSGGVTISAHEIECYSHAQDTHQSTFYLHSLRLFPYGKSYLVFHVIYIGGSRLLPTYHRPGANYQPTPSFLKDEGGRMSRE